MRTWPTHKQWQQQAEHAVRTACHPHQRVTADPATWLAEAELAEARKLADAIVRATRTALTRAGRAAERPTLNAYGREARRPGADLDDLHTAWTRILRIARSLDVAPGNTGRLEYLAQQMRDARDRAAEQALREAIDREIDRRASDEGWEKELQRRARVERGPQITTITVHADGTSTTGEATPFRSRA